MLLQQQQHCCEADVPSSRNGRRVKVSALSLLSSGLRPLLDFKLKFFSLSCKLRVEYIYIYRYANGSMNYLMSAENRKLKTLLLACNKTLYSRSLVSLLCLSLPRIQIRITLLFFFFFAYY